VATKATRPGRVLIAFLIVIAALYAGVAAAGDWKPRLGLDLQGGTRITLQAKTAEAGEKPPADQMDEAKNIIEQRVNGSGVSESEVAIQGDSQIVVEIPGQEKQGIAEQIGRTAKLYFRLVWAAQSAPQPGQVPQAPAITLPPAPQNTGSSGGTPTDESTANNRAAPGFGNADPTDTPSSGATESTDDSGDQPDSTGDLSDLTQDESVALANSVSQSTGGGTAPSGSETAYNALVTKMNEFECPTGGAAPQVKDDPEKPLVTCDEDGGKYVLSPALIEGTQLDDASATIPQQGLGWEVQLELDGGGTDTLADISSAMVGQGSRFAIVLDGQVLSAPVFDATISDGNAQISGDFNQDSAQALATSLKYGALPLSFEVGGEGGGGVEVIGPSLAGTQLDAGLLAGAVGLALVIAYCMVYYRGLGIVVVASLGVAAAITYAMVLLLGTSMGFTLTLPGIAGLIVAVGITADSFIVFFERLRDEVRDGKSLRLAVEAGWRRARLTIIAADSVSFLAALVLYIFAIGVVRGFAFALGLTTLIDVFIVFFFTKPLVSLLARTRFFGQGHRFSGFDAHHLGIEGRSVSRMAPTVRGEA
jgi:preprotein translocase subunit SecD